MEENNENEKLEELYKKGDKPKPVILVPSIDEAGHTVFLVSSINDKELLQAGIGNPKGVVIKTEGTESEKRCPIEPNKLYKDSICAKMEMAFYEALKKNALQKVNVDSEVKKESEEKKEQEKHE